MFRAYFLVDANQLLCFPAPCGASVIRRAQAVWRQCYCFIKSSSGLLLLGRKYRLCSTCGLENVDGWSSLSVKAQRPLSPVLSSQMCAGGSYHPGRK